MRFTFIQIRFTDILTCHRFKLNYTHKLLSFLPPTRWSDDSSDNLTGIYSPSIKVKSSKPTKQQTHKYEWEKTNKIYLNNDQEFNNFVL